MIIFRRWSSKALQDIEETISSAVEAVTEIYMPSFKSLPLKLNHFGLQK